MGLDAFVSCNCYKEGKTSPFPLPELEQYFGLFNGVWDLKLPDGDFSTPVDLWMRDDACEHEFMQLTAEGLASWSAFRDFQKAFSEIGWQHFPTLQAELPNANGGTMPSESSAKALPELDYFQRQTHFGRKFLLVDTETGDVIDESYRGIFIWAGQSAGVLVGIDPDGLFIQTSDEPPVTCFRAKRFEQRPLNTTGTDPEAAVVEFYDADTEARFQSPIALERYVRLPNGRWHNDEGKANTVMPRLMHVAERRVGVEEYDYIVQPLIRLCKASVETGNPVVWC